jgi:hypothetical protein
MNGRVMFMPGGVEYKKFDIYPVMGTQTGVTINWTGIIDVPQLYDGLTIAYYLPYASTDTSATLNLTLSTGQNTGAIACYYTGTQTITSQYTAGNVIILTYFSANSIKIGATTINAARWLCCDNANTLLCNYNTYTDINGASVIAAY